jgi:hypothetical protein
MVPWWKPTRYNELKISSETLGTVTTALRNLGETYHVTKGMVLRQQIAEVAWNLARNTQLR